MGQKMDLTGSEKSKIVRYLAEGCSSLKIAKLLKRDHRTIKRFIQNSQQGRKKRVEKPRRKITARELRKVKRAAAKMPPVWPYFRAATSLECPKTQGVQYSETWPR